MVRQIKLVSGAIVVGLWTLLSRILGFVRDVLIAAWLGTGPVAEAFLIAFALPNMFRRFFAEGAFNAAFVPMFSKRLESDAAPDRFATDALNALALCTLALTALAMIFMPGLVWVTAAGFEGDARFDLTVGFGRIVFPYIFFISLAALISGVLNASGRFAAAAAAPVFLNIILISVLALSATVFPGLAAIEAIGPEWLPWFPLHIADATGGVNGRELAGQKLVPPGWAESIGFSAEEPGRYRYFPILLLAGFAFWTVSNLLKSRPGRAMVAIRDNETGAAVSGVALTKSKVTSFAISASYAGLGGAMWAMDKGFVAQQDYNVALAIDLLVALVIGGVATIPGAVVGALIVVFVREFAKGLEIPLGFYTIDGGGPLSQAIFGFILVVVTFFAPGGLVWLFRLIKSKFYRVIPEIPELSEPVIPLGQTAEAPVMAAT